MASRLSRSRVHGPVDGGHEPRDYQDAAIDCGVLLRAPQAERELRTIAGRIIDDRTKILVVFSRCGEPGLGAVGKLAAQSIPYRVYQKGGSCNSTRGAQTLAKLPANRVRIMEHNSGDECAAYLQYLHEYLLGRRSICSRCGASSRPAPTGMARTSRRASASRVGTRAR